MRWVAIALILTSCSTTTNALEPATTAEAEGYTAYGGAGQLDTGDLATMQDLAWPQVRPDMLGTFGYPSKVTETADVYKLVDGSEIWVFYEADTATGYEVRNP